MKAKTTVFIYCSCILILTIWTINSFCQRPNEVTTHPSFDNSKKNDDKPFVLIGLNDEELKQLLQSFYMAGFKIELDEKDRKYFLQNREKVNNQLKKYFNEIINDYRENKENKQSSLALLIFDGEARTNIRNFGIPVKFQDVALKIEPRYSVFMSKWGSRGKNIPKNVDQQNDLMQEIIIQEAQKKDTIRIYDLILKGKLIAIKGNIYNNLSSSNKILDWLNYEEINGDKIRFVNEDGYEIILDLKDFKITPKQAVAMSSEILINNEILKFTFSSDKNIIIYPDGNIFGKGFIATHRWKMDYNQPYIFDINNFVEVNTNIEIPYPERGIFFTGIASRNDNPLNLKDKSFKFNLIGHLWAENDFAFILTQLEESTNVYPIPGYKIKLSEGVIVFRYGLNQISIDVNLINGIIKSDNNLVSIYNKKRKDILKLYVDVENSYKKGSNSYFKVIKSIKSNQEYHIVGQFKANIEGPSYTLYTGEREKFIRKGICMLTDTSGTIFTNTSFPEIRVGSTKMSIKGTPYLSYISFSKWAKLESAQNTMQNDLNEGLVIQNGHYYLEMPQISIQSIPEQTGKFRLRTMFWGNITLTNSGLSGNLFGGGYLLMPDFYEEDFDTVDYNFKKFSLEEVILFSDSIKIKAKIEQLKDSLDNSGLKFLKEFSNVRIEDDLYAKMEKSIDKIYSNLLRFQNNVFNRDPRDTIRKSFTLSDSILFYRGLYYYLDTIGYIQLYSNLRQQIDFYEHRLLDLKTPPYQYTPPEPRLFYTLSDTFKVYDLRIDSLVLDRNDIASSLLKAKIFFPLPFYGSYTFNFSDLDTLCQIYKGYAPFTIVENLDTIEYNSKNAIHFYWKLPITMNSLFLDLGSRRLNQATNPKVDISGWLNIPALSQIGEKGIWFTGSLFGNGEMAINTEAIIDLKYPNIEGDNYWFGKDHSLDHPCNINSIEFTTSPFGQRKFDYKFKLYFPHFPFFRFSSQFYAFNDSLFMDPVDFSMPPISRQKSLFIPSCRRDDPDCRDFDKIIYDGKLSYDYNEDIFKSFDSIDYYVANTNNSLVDDLFATGYKLKIYSMTNAKFVRCIDPRFAYNSDSTLRFKPYYNPPRSLTCFDEELRDYFVREEIIKDQDKVIYDSLCRSEDYLTGDMVILEAGDEQKIKLLIPNTEILKAGITYKENKESDSLNLESLDIQDSIKIENATLSLEGMEPSSGLNFKIPGLCKLQFDDTFTSIQGEFTIDLNYCPAIPLKGANIYFYINTKEGYFIVIGDATASYYLDLQGVLFVTHCPDYILQNGFNFNDDPNYKPFEKLSEKAGFKNKEQFIYICYNENLGDKDNVIGGLIGVTAKLDENFERLGFIKLRIGGGLFYWHYSNSHVLGTYLQANAEINACILAAEVHAAVSARFFPTTLDVVAAGEIGGGLCVGAIIGHCKASINANVTYGTNSGLKYKIKPHFGCGWGCCKFN